MRSPAIVVGVCDAVFAELAGRTFAEAVAVVARLRRAGWSVAALADLPMPELRALLAAADVRP